MEKNNKFNRQFCYDIVKNHLITSKKAASKQMISKRTGFAQSTIGKALSKLRKEHIIVLHRRKYWCVKD